MHGLQPNHSTASAPHAVHKISCPTLLVGGTKDVITPLAHVERAKNLIGDK